MDSGFFAQCYAIYMLLSSEYTLCCSEDVKHGSTLAWCEQQTEDPRDLGSIPTTGHVQTCCTNFFNHVASVQTAVMGTWWNTKC